MNVIGNQGIPSIANVIDDYVKSGNPFAGNALNLGNAVPQATIPTLNVGNPLAVESSTTTEETNPFKMKPKKGRLHAPLAERTGDKYLDVGNRYGNLASQAITGLYNKEIDDYNAAEEARRLQHESDRADSLLDWKKDMIEADNIELSEGKPQDVPFYSDYNKFMSPEKAKQYSDALAVLERNRQFNTMSKAGKQAMIDEQIAKANAAKTKMDLEREYRAAGRLLGSAKQYAKPNNLRINTKTNLNDRELVKAKIANAVNGLSPYDKSEQLGDKALRLLAGMNLTSNKTKRDLAESDMLRNTQRSVSIASDEYRRKGFEPEGVYFGSDFGIDTKNERARALGETIPHNGAMIEMVRRDNAGNPQEVVHVHIVGDEINVAPDNTGEQSFNDNLEQLRNRRLNPYE